MALHFFSTIEKQLLVRGLYLVAQHVCNRVENAQPGDLTEDDKDNLVELAQDVNVLITACFLNDQDPGYLELHEADCLSLYKGLQRLNIYANSIRELWLKGGCLDQCLYNISLSLSGQVNDIINKHFSAISSENIGSTEA